MISADDFAPYLSNAVVPYDMPGVVVGNNGGTKLRRLTLATLLHLGLQEYAEPKDRAEVEELVVELEYPEHTVDDATIDSEIVALELLNDLFTEPGFTWEIDSDGALGLYED